MHSTNSTTYSHLMTNHIKLATTAGLVIAMTMLILIIGRSIGVLQVAYNDVNARHMFLQMKTIINWDNLLNMIVLTSVVYLAYQMFSIIIARIVNFVRQYLFKFLTGLSLFLWIGRRTQMSQDTIELISHQFTFGLIIGIIITSISYKFFRSSTPKKNDEKIGSNIPLRVGQVEHIIRKEIENSPDNTPIISLLMKRIQLLEERSDNAAYVRQVAVEKHRLDEDETEDEDLEVYLSDDDLKKPSKRSKTRNVFDSDESMTEPEDTEYLPITKPIRRRRSKSIQLPVQRKKPFRNIEPKNKKQKEVEKCPHCADTLTKNHKCWVLEKQIKCFKCGGPNHIAVACKSKGFGMQMDVLNKMDEEQIQKEILRLNRLLAMKRKPRNNDDLPLKGHVVRRRTRSDPERKYTEDMDVVIEDEAFLSTPPQL